MFTVCQSNGLLKNNGDPLGNWQWPFSEQQSLLPILMHPRRCIDVWYPNWSHCGVYRMFTVCQSNGLLKNNGDPLGNWQWPFSEQQSLLPILMYPRRCIDVSYGIQIWALITLLSFIQLSSNVQWRKYSISVMKGRKKNVLSGIGQFGQNFMYNKKPKYRNMLLQFKTTKTTFYIIQKQINIFHLQLIWLTYHSKISEKLRNKQTCEVKKNFFCNFYGNNWIFFQLKI